MLNITSKYFSFFNNNAAASSVANVSRDILTCYSCSYDSSMIKSISCFMLRHHIILDSKSEEQNNRIQEQNKKYFSKAK